MKSLRLQTGLPQLGQVHFMSDGRGGGSDMTLVNEGGSVNDAGDEISSHPLLCSTNVNAISGFVRDLPKKLPTYDGERLTELAKVLIALATRTPWSDFPDMSGEAGYAELWHERVLQPVALFFPNVVAAVVKQTPITEVATYLQARCDDIYNRTVLMMMFGACIAALPRAEYAPMIKAYLSAMIRRSDLCDAEKLPKSLQPIMGAIRSLERDDFMKIYQELSGIEKELKARDPDSTTASDFIRGVCDLYFAE